MLAAEVDRLELRFEDDSTLDVELVWVSPPVDAGFFVHEYRERRLREGSRPRELLALDADGDEVARHEFRYSDPRWEPGRDGLPAAADRSRKRTVFDFRDQTGRQWTLVTAPGPDGRLCYRHDRGGGCLRPEDVARTTLGVIPGDSVAVCCRAGEGVERVELRYENSERETVRPVDGWLLHVIAPRHYAVGRRLELVVAFDAAGREVARTPAPTRRAGIYPCKEGEERDFGAGFELCP